MKSTIFPVLRNDDITRAIRYDELVIRYGNRLSEKLSQTHHNDHIRANMRLLGRFKIELLKLAPEILELKDMFKPFLFDKAIEALRLTAKYEFGKGFAGCSYQFDKYNKKNVHDYKGMSLSSNIMVI